MERKRKPYEPPGIKFERKIEAVAGTCTPGPDPPDNEKKNTNGQTNGFLNCSTGNLTS